MRLASEQLGVRVVAGVDGCKAGWFAVWGDGGETWDFDVFPDFTTLWQALNEATLILVDIPIGMPFAAPRRCDIEARRRLGHPRGSSVFPAPCREALSAESHAEASAINRKVLGKGITRQCWGICPKIRQVDDLLRSDKEARGIVREGHPEVAFWTFAGVPMACKKSTAMGVQERLGVLRVRWSAVDDLLIRATRRYSRTEVGRDDIVDAVAMYLTAASSACAIRTIPDLPDRDRLGQPMEMVFAGR